MGTMIASSMDLFFFGTVAFLTLAFLICIIYIGHQIYVMSSSSYRKKMFNKHFDAREKEYAGNPAELEMIKHIRKHTYNAYFNNKK